MQEPNFVEQVARRVQTHAANRLEVSFAGLGLGLPRSFGQTRFKLPFDAVLAVRTGGKDSSPGEGSVLLLSTRVSAPVRRAIFTFQPKLTSTRRLRTGQSGKEIS